jgi:hypothetical protein
MLVSYKSKKKKAKYEAEVSTILILKVEINKTDLKKKIIIKIQK